MAKHYATQLSGVKAHQRPDLAPYAGHKLARKSVLPPIGRSQDKIPALGRRVVVAQSLSGEIEWLTPDTDPTQFGSTRTHPVPDAERIMARGHAQITPGCCLRLSVLYVPSGQTQIFLSPDFVDGGADARIMVRVQWTASDATVLTTEHVVALDPSMEEFAAQPAAPWAAIRLAKIPIVAPVINTPALAARWSSHIGAEIEIVHIGGCRIVDACLSETPYWFGREADDAGDLWCAHLYSTAGPDGAAVGGNDYAWQRWSDTSPDGVPMGGTWHMLDVAHAQGLRLGPHLFSWTSYSESGADPTDDDVHDDDPITTTSATFVGLIDAALTAYDEDEPGWTISSPALARDADENDPYWTADPGDPVGGSLPVIVAVYAGGDTGVLRVQASASSWVDVDITATDGWHLGYGHLECGIGIGDEKTAQAFIRRTGATNPVAVSALSVYRLRTEPR
jgi:hypothetical protein